ncbi:ATP-binding protein [Actinorugispora endophytica]|uniref:ATPase family protein associated with various cellular activities (AAA) n=1 Tax=Actinorugispora endophytica TaxID=1605990 RepID=A0A4R6V1H8_9ACTN|nr:ATP-binding protein [Actinorugispora endophytica]TDQ53733.1 ATPase family protein associated with various cellular activities (AAA) [Actinorugispora endophytica]
MIVDVSPALINGLRTAVAAAPQDIALRLHLAELLVSRGDIGAAIAEIGQALHLEPESGQARALMARALAPAPVAGTDRGAPASGPGPRGPDDGGAPPSGFDWEAAEGEVEHIVEPRYVTSTPEKAGRDGYEAERPRVTLADVGGMEQVKQRLNAAFLAPVRNPGLRKLYGKSLKGGLLLYGPPGCGKTFLARALAGELGADFVSVGISDVLDMYVGQSERNVSALFEQARRRAPCVLFIDELDALGRRRNGGNPSHSTVHQLLTELDNVDTDNEGVFVLGATNQPWDVDPALRRPGRFDRTVLVTPPDASAREAILRSDLEGRPIEGIDTGALAAATDGFSGADMVHLCESAAERALLDSVDRGRARMIGMGDFEEALTEVRSSTGPWLEAARGVAMFANEGGAYDDLVAYLDKGGGR